MLTSDVTTVSRSCVMILHTSMVFRALSVGELLISAIHFRCEDHQRWGEKHHPMLYSELQPLTALVRAVASFDAEEIDMISLPLFLKDLLMFRIYLNAGHSGSEFMTALIQLMQQLTKSCPRPRQHPLGRGEMAGSLIFTIFFRP